MFALRSVFRGLRARRQTVLPVEIGRPGSAAAPASTGTGRVLPRVLRRPVRLAARLVADGAETPRYAAAIMSLALTGSAAAYGAILGGHMPSVIQAVTAHTGFAIEEIKISGHKETSEIDILGELELNGWTSLIGFSAEEARQKIARLPWIDNVSIRKSYPSTLEIRVVERKPFAIWQNGSKLSLVERSGSVITSYPGAAFAALPLVVGFGAPEKAPDIIALAAAEPELGARVKAYIRVSDRRWDLRLENGVTVKLPADGAEQALADLVALDRDEGLLSRDIESVDMRLADRMTVRLTSQAVEHRKAALKEEEKRRRQEKRT